MFSEELGINLLIATFIHWNWMHQRWNWKKFIQCCNDALFKHSLHYTIRISAEKQSQQQNYFVEIKFHKPKTETKAVRVAVLIKLNQCSSYLNQIGHH